MRDSRCLRRPATTAAALVWTLFAADPVPAGDLRAGLPPIVYVSRTPATGIDAGQVPGLGPHGSFVTSPGSLMERARDGHVRALLAPGRLQAVADPAVSPDTRRVAFAAIEAPGGPWRIWVVDRAGGEPRCVTCGAPDKAPPDDDVDPCWWGADTLLFASTRAGGRALYDGSRVTQLYLLAPGGEPEQLTHEANGALDPCVDARTRRVLYARWWFNPWRSARTRGVTRDTAQVLTRDSVNVWQVVAGSLARDARGGAALTGVRLAAGGTLPRRRGMGIQPALTSSGAVLAVSARNTGLAPRPGTLSLQRFAAPPSSGQRLAGAAIGDDVGDPYTESANLAAPAACAPVALRDGRVLCALDPSGRGDFGLWLLSADGESRERLLDAEGTLELDPDVVVPYRQAARRDGARAAKRPSLLYIYIAHTFRYLVTDIFAGRGAPARRTGARLHVFRLVNADSVEHIHDAAVPRSGRIDLQLPADTPLFEQLTDANGRALMSAHGPAQVRGFNSGAEGATSRCTGCHLGHSAATR